MVGPWPSQSLTLFSDTDSTSKAAPPRAEKDDEASPALEDGTDELLLSLSLLLPLLRGSTSIDRAPPLLIESAGRPDCTANARTGETRVGVRRAPGSQRAAGMPVWLLPPLTPLLDPSRDVLELRLLLAERLGHMPRVSSAAAQVMLCQAESRG